MKKNLLAIFAIIISAFVFSSCEKNESPGACKSCESENFEVLNANILGKSYLLKEFSGENGSKFMYSNKNSASDLIHVFEQVKKAGITQVNYDSIAAVVFFIDKTVNPGLSLNFSDIKHVAFYTKINKKEFNFKIFSSKDGNFIEDLRLQSRTNKISSNDINSLTLLLFDSSAIPSTISFYNTENLQSEVTSSRNELHSKILSLLPSNKVLKGGVKCGLPCTTHDIEGDCTLLSGTGSVEPVYYCDPPMCPSDETEEQEMHLDPHATEKYNFGGIHTDLYSFRDNYLSIYGGKDFINLYYSFSGKLDLTKLTLTFCTNTFDVITNYITPITRNLVSNPNSGTILIDSSKNTVIKNYLISVKGVVIDQQSKDNIDTIILKLDEFTGKTNSYITSHLKI